MGLEMLTLSSPFPCRLLPLPAAVGVTAEVVVCWEWGADFAKTYPTRVCERDESGGVVFS